MVKPDCSITLITSNKPADVTYNLGSGNVEISFSEWTVDFPICGTFSYSFS